MCTHIMAVCVYTSSHIVTVSFKEHKLVRADLVTQVQINYHRKICKVLLNIKVHSRNMLSCIIDLLLSRCFSSNLMSANGRARPLEQTPVGCLALGHNIKAGIKQDCDFSNCPVPGSSLLGTELAIFVLPILISSD